MSRRAWRQFLTGTRPLAPLTPEQADVKVLRFINGMIVAESLTVLASVILVITWVVTGNTGCLLACTLLVFVTWADSVLVIAGVITWRVRAIRRRRRRNREP